MLSKGGSVGMTIPIGTDRGADVWYQAELERFFLLVWCSVSLSRAVSSEPRLILYPEIRVGGASARSRD
jgi:hypothetical protein